MPSGFMSLHKAMKELRRLGVTITKDSGHWIFRHPDIMRPVHQHVSDHTCNAKTMSMIRRLRKNGEKPSAP